MVSSFVRFFLVPFLSCIPLTLGRVYIIPVLAHLHIHLTNPIHVVYHISIAPKLKSNLAGLQFNHKSELNPLA